jgi:hypothetical protein
MIPLADFESLQATRKKVLFSGQGTYDTFDT